jgi:predicted P-loop ATPase
MGQSCSSNRSEKKCEGKYRSIIPIKMIVNEIGWVWADWIHLDQDRDQWWGLANTVMNLWVP